MLKTWFVSDLVGNPDNRFSHDVAQMTVINSIFDRKQLPIGNSLQSKELLLTVIDLCSSYVRKLFDCLLSLLIYDGVITEQSQNCFVYPIVHINKEKNTSPGLA